MGEIGRRLVHASGVAFPAVYLLGPLTWQQFGVLLGSATVVAFILEVLRLRVGVDWWIYRKLTRPYEDTSIAGYALYMLSITIVSLVFSPSIAIPAMLMLMLGDPVSGYVGSGELRAVKTRTAIVAMFVVCLALAIPFALDVLGNAIGAAIAAIVAAALATAADGIKPTVRGYVIDDNLTIPLAAAIGLWAAYQAIPAFL